MLHVGKVKARRTNKVILGAQRAGDARVTLTV
jgi:hypothetical protein